MQNFQGIVFVSTQTYREVLTSRLLCLEVKLIPKSISKFPRV